MALAWSPHMRLGIPQVDHAHRLFVARLGCLEHSADHEWLLRLTELAAGMEHAFAAEEALMESLAAPGLAPHREQHAKVLGMLRQAINALQRADHGPARATIALLPHWFLIHLATMDLELSVAARIFTRATGACDAAAQSRHG